MAELNKFSTYMWVRNVITSCETSDQLDNCENLILNFDNMYKDKSLRKVLIRHITDRWMYSLLNDKL
jgi:hypothetical protein